MQILDDLHIFLELGIGSDAKSQFDRVFQAAHVELPIALVDVRFCAP